MKAFVVVDDKGRALTRFNSAPQGVKSFMATSRIAVLAQSELVSHPLIFGHPRVVGWFG